MDLVLLENEQDFEEIHCAIDRVLLLGARDDATVRLVALAARALLTTHDEAEAAAAEATDLRADIEELRNDLAAAEGRADNAEERADDLEYELKQLRTEAGKAGGR